MDRNEYLKKIIAEFDKWYLSDEHSKNIDFYKDTITKLTLESLTQSDFIDFFTKFIILGGKVQSGGERSKNKFINTLNIDFTNFKSFVLEPFDSNFSLKDWFKRADDFKGFGIGIATIYLNRIDNNRYPIMNNKTIDALKKLGFAISTSKNFSNYELVYNIQKELIKQFPTLTQLSPQKIFFIKIKAIFAELAIPNR